MEKLSARSTVGMQIALHRQSQGLTQEELAEKSGVHRTNVNKIERGTYNVSVDILDKICTALNLEITLTERSSSI